MSLFLDELAADDKEIIERFKSFPEPIARYDGASILQILNGVYGQKRLDFLGFSPNFHPQVAQDDDEATVFYWYGWSSQQGEFPLLLATLATKDFDVDYSPKLGRALWSAGLIEVEFVDSPNPAEAVLEAAKDMRQRTSIEDTFRSLEAVFPHDAVRFEARRVAMEQE